MNWSLKFLYSIFNIFLSDICVTFTIELSARYTPVSIKEPRMFPDLWYGNTLGRVLVKKPLQ